VPECVLFITATFNLSSQRLCTKANTFPARGLPRAQRPRASSFFRNFSKNSENFVEANRTSERFLNGNLNLQKVKMTACAGWRVTIRSKLLVLTPPWLQHEDLRVLL
jgi:hypothetical protein